MALKPMHKPRVGSLGTNASGISNISNAASLSQFPEPPDSIPPISLRLDPYHTPGAPHSPATPSHSYPGTPISGRSAPRRKKSAYDNSQYPFGPNFSSSSAAQGDFAYNDYDGSTPPPTASGSTTPLRRKHHTPERGTTTSSRGEWHDGASQSIIDENEDRMPSTSFITSVLSSADHRARSHTPIDSSSSHLAHDGMSSISEMSYPPRPGAFRTHPASDPIARALPSSQNPPGTFLTMDDDQSAVGSTVTVDSYGVGGSVIRTASMSKSLGARGASVVGYASGTIRRVASTSKSPTSPIHREKRQELRSSSPIPDDEHDVQRMAISDFRADHDAASYSPARRSSVGFQPDDHLTRRSVAPPRESKSASFFSNLTANFGGWFAPKSHPAAATTAYPYTQYADEAAYKSKEDNLRLPQLVSRAGALEGMLAQGHRPHHSMDTYASRNGHRRPVVSPWDSKYREDMTTRHTYVSSHFPTPSGSWPAAPNGDAVNPPRFTHRRKAILGIILFLIAIALGVGLGVGLPKKHTPVTCPAGLAGNSCTLNSTCVCTSTLPGQCDALSQNLINLIPTLNDIFVANYTPKLLSDAVWAAQGAPPANQCQSQAVIVDVAPALDDMTAPNRTLWAQSALLWNFVQSQNTAALETMQQFVADAPWGDLSQADGPVSDGASKFVVSSTGFKFDFAAQTVIPPNVTFASNGNPSSAQAAQVASTASSALDRMYSFALASSTQRQQPLQSYWAGALAQNSGDLATFTSAISTAPILLPFDATASPVSTLLTNSTTSPFPVPLACYPSLNSTQLQLLNDVETIVYGLGSASVMSQVDTSCFPDRPLYGVLDILHLRQPFVDSRTGVARQAAALQRDVAPRAVIHSGEVLSALPGTPITSAMPGSEVIDPRQYGTTNHLNHVVLNFLSSIPDINVAIALVEFVLSGSSVPPANNTALYNALDSIPTLEVAIFGTVTPNDVSSVVSSFETPSGSLFFGSDQSSSVRNWAINGVNSSIQWSQYSASPEVVRDTLLSSSTFDSVWIPAYEWFHTTTSQVVTVATIVEAFQATGQFAA